MSNRCFVMHVVLLSPLTLAPIALASLPGLLPPFSQALIREGHMIYVIDISLPALPSGGLRAEGDESGASGEQGQAQHWTIYKRYSDFVKLRKILLANSKSFALSPTGRSARGVSIPDIPPKRWRNFTPQVPLTTAIAAMLFEKGEKYIARFAAWLWHRIGL